ncbi:MAG: dTDP-glucose 4,6-dehydratase [Desulfovibrio sp.]|nr:dTDP-glucose 4,6-dehydratase [Desulfovibrio sp.]
MKTLLVTGGAGFIGSNLILKALADTPYRIVNLDKLTYSGNLESLREAENNPRYEFVRADVADSPAIRSIIDAVRPDGIMHLAAESHVDRSIDRADEFIETNVKGPFVMLEAARQYWKNLKAKEKAENFRFLHISTDEVFGDLADGGGKFDENTPYAPSSPYSASKAGSDHLVRAWHRTYGLPTLITNCSNNYGPRQFPEKLIPLTIINAIEGKKLPVYGQGAQIRDWLYVDDHADALLRVMDKGVPGETYTVGGNSEKRNIDVVMEICSRLDEKVPAESPYEELIEFVRDRPGHDARYAIDAGKIRRELGWTPKRTFADGIDKTIDWYLNNREWWENIRSGKYQGQRLGVNI